MKLPLYIIEEVCVHPQLLFCLPLFKSGPFGVLQGSLESCKDCGSHDDEEEAGCDESVAANGSTSCSCPDNTKPGKNACRLGLSLFNKFEGI